MSESRHTLHITTTHDDGRTSEWAYDQPGPAADAHEQLVKRWKAARLEFTRDRAALTITRHYPDPDRGGPYTDTIRHIPWNEEKHV